MRLFRPYVAAQSVHESSVTQNVFYAVCTHPKLRRKLGWIRQTVSTSVTEAGEQSRRGAAALFQTHHLQRGSQAAIPLLQHLWPEGLRPHIHSEQATIRG